MRMKESQYKKRNSIKATFADGTLPGWLSTGVSGGSVNVTQNNMGRAVLASGTAATNDYARIEGSTGYWAGEADAIGIRAVIGLDSGAATDGTAQVFVSMKNSAGDEAFRHKINSQADPSNSIEIETGGSSTFFDTAVMQRAEGDYTQEEAESEVETELLFDTKNEVIHHWYQGSWRQRVTSTLPSEATSYKPDLFCQTRDTSADRKLQVFEVEVAYYDSLRR